MKAALIFVTYLVLVSTSVAADGSGPTVSLCGNALTSQMLDTIAREEAARRAKPATPEYYAALRDAIERISARALQNPCDDSRSIADLASKDPESPEPPLIIDSDPRYQAWLDSTSTISTLQDDSGQVDVRSIGGTRPSSEKMFANVVVLMSSIAIPYCSGALLTDRVVLTAAHCVCDIRTGVTSLPSQVRVGIFPSKPLDVKLVSKAEGHWYKPADAYCGIKDSRKGRDYALVRLREPVSASLNVPAVRLPSADIVNAMAPGQQMWVVGFGPTSAARVNQAGPKNFIMTPIISPNCSSKGVNFDESEKYGCVSGKELLSVDPKGLGVCTGDSGGAAFQYVNGKLYLVGLVSRIVKNGRCGDGGIYTLLTPEVVKDLEAERARLERAS